MVQFIPGADYAPQSPGAGFFQGLGGGLNQGYQLGFQSIAQQRLAREAELQAAMQQQKMEMQRQQQEMDKVTALVNVARIKDPKTRKGAFEYIAPQLGFDTKNPAFKSFTDLIGTDDPELLSTFQQAASELGITPGVTKLLATSIQEDPAGTINQLLSLKRNLSTAELREAGLAQGNQRIDQAEERLRQADRMLNERLAGNLTPEQFRPFEQEIRTPEGEIRTERVPQVFRPGIGGRPSQLSPVPGAAPVVTGQSSGLSADQQKDISDIGQQRALVDQAVQAISKDPGAFDWKKGSAVGGAGELGQLPRAFMERQVFTPEQIQARSFLFNQVSGVIKERAGTAQSASEQKRLNAFLPSEYDSADQINAKLKGFRGYLDEREKSVKPAYRPNAPATPSEAPAAPAGAPQRKALAPEAEAQLLSLARKYKAGTISQAELEQFKALARAKGFEVR